MLTDMQSNTQAETVPFFARFLESQKSAKSTQELNAAAPVTYKYPSDDEDY